MHALIVVAHPEPGSLSHAIAAALATGVEQSAPGNTFEIADLTAEEFDPRFTARDIAVHLEQARPDDDVVAERARIDRADALVLVYPVYWWSMPAMLKGWIDRVFSNGWGYAIDPETGKTIKKLHHLRVHLVALAGADAGTYVRHGYGGAMKTQIEHGIFDYCGARVLTSDMLFGTHASDVSRHLGLAHDIGRDLFDAASPSESRAA